jgi:hypothetical protein
MCSAGVFPYSVWIGRPAVGEAAELDGVVGPLVEAVPLLEVPAGLGAGGGEDGVEDSHRRLPPPAVMYAAAYAPRMVATPSDDEPDGRVDEGRTDRDEGGAYQERDDYQDGHDRDPLHEVRPPG